MKRRARGYYYETEEVPGLEHLSGRVVVSFDKDFRQSYVLWERYRARMEVVEILAERVKMAEFPGYSSVLITFEQLQHIVRNNIDTWRSALKSVGGVYLITDTECGRHYVGSAYGVEGIWARWCEYAAGGHGENVDLRDALKERGNDHAKHFQFSILEICDVMQSKDEVISRETHWKKALCTRGFGYNRN